MQSDQEPYVTVLWPHTHRNQLIRLTEGELVVGRADSCGLRFDDPYLSRVHAKLEHRGEHVRVTDLGSSGGTFVNGHPLSGSCELRHGDIVTLGNVQLQLATSAPSQVPPHEVRYDVGDQRASTINNVGRDQYNAYIHQRESFLREVAATKTRARWLMWSGFIVFVIGFVVELVGSLGFMNGVTSAFPDSADPFGSPPSVPSMGGFQLAFVGAAVSAIGIVLFVVGLVLHVVAASRRKRVDRQMPITFAPSPY